MCSYNQLWQPLRSVQSIFEYELGRGNSVEKGAESWQGRRRESIQIEAKWQRTKICVQISLTLSPAEGHLSGEDNIVKDSSNACSECWVTVQDNISKDEGKQRVGQERAGESEVSRTHVHDFQSWRIWLKKQNF